MIQPAYPSASDSTARLAVEMRPALVRYFFRRTRDMAEAEDLAQDVLTSVFAHARWTSAEEARGYIFRAAVNRWKDRCRRRGVRPAHLPLDGDEDDRYGSSLSPERVLVSQEELRLISHALEELNPRTRAALILVKVERMKIAAVAKLLGISSRAVDKHLAKGLAHLMRVRGPQVFP